MRRPGLSRWPALDDDVAEEYRQDAIADERAEDLAHELGFEDAEAMERAERERGEIDERDIDQAAIYDQDNDTEWPSRSDGE